MLLWHRRQSAARCRTSLYAALAGAALLLVGLYNGLVTGKFIALEVA